MATAHEALEHAEHAAHAGHGEHGGGHGKTGTYVGLTMAVLGVLLAFCSALVGAERTELVRRMVEQSDAHTKYQAQNTKHRLALTQLQTLHSNLVSQKDVQRIDAQLGALVRKADASPAPAASSSAVTTAALAAPKVASAARASEGATTIEASRDHVALEGLVIASKEIVQILSPDRRDAQQLLSLAKKYEAEAEAGRAWTESYDEAIEAHVEASERYERSQLAAEIGIVVASIALLLSSRKIWAVSLLFGAAAVGYMGFTYATIHPHVAHGEAAIAEKKQAYTRVRDANSQKAEDEKLMAEVEQAVAGAE